MQEFYFPTIIDLPEEESNMAVTDSRIQKIEEKINILSEKIAGFPGQLKTLFWIVGILFTIILTGGGFIVKELLDQGKDIATVKGELSGVKEGLTDVKQLILSQRLVQATVDPKNPINIKEVSNILSNAKQQQLRIDPNIIKETGFKFITASKTNPASWQGVQQFLEYRSFLNTILAPSPSDLKPVKHWEKLFTLHVYCTINPKTISIDTQGSTTPENSAQMETLDQLKPATNGPELIVVKGEGCTIILDNQYLKNVIVKNFYIEYHGGAMVLENVYFVNCTFNFDLIVKSQELGKAILTSTGTTFKSIL